MDARDTRGAVKRHIFGLRSDVHGALQWLDDRTLLYAAGKNVVLHATSSNTQRFIETSYRSTGPTALAVSANKKFIAVAEGGDDPQVHIIDTATRKRRRVLSLGDLGSQRFTALAFSGDGRHLLTQGGAPLWRLCYWNAERSKPLATVSLAEELPVVAEDNATPAATAGPATPASRGGGSRLVTHIALCPVDPLLISVSGVGMLRTYRYVHGVLEVQPACGYPAERHAIFTAHTWLDAHRLVAATASAGDAMICVDHGRYAGTVPAPPAEAASYGDAGLTYITSIIATRQGFISGTNTGQLHLYERSGTSYQLLCSLSLLQSEPRDLADPTERSVTQAAYSTALASTTAATSGEALPTFLWDAEGAADGSSSAAAEPPASRFAALRDVVRAGATAAPRAHAGAATAKSHPAATRPAAAGGRTAVTTADTAVPLPGTAVYGVASMALDQAEETLAVATRGGQILALDFACDWHAEDAARQATFTAVCESFHTGAINGVSCSVRRPLLMTSGNDHTVRLWNTQTNRLVLCAHYALEPGAVALHPDGYMAVICFADKVRVCSVLWNRLQEHQTVNYRNVTDVQFASGGQFFSLVHGNQVELLHAATCEPLGQLRGHPQRIRDLKWCATSPYPTDNRIVTCAADGLVVDWNATEARREVEYTDKRFRYVAVASDDKSIWAVAEPTPATALDVSWKTTLQEIERHHPSAAATSATESFEFSDATLTTLTVAAHRRVLFAGSTDGSMRVMAFPLAVGVQEPAIAAHSAAVTRVVLSFNERMLFTASEDGSLISWDINADPRSAVSLTDAAPTADAVEEVLVSQRDAELAAVEVESLQQQVTKLNNTFDAEERRHRHEQTTRLRERADEFRGEAAAQAAAYAVLWNAKAEQERAFVAVKQEKEAEAARALEQLERRRQKEVQELEEECTRLQDMFRKTNEEEAAALETLAQRSQHEAEADAAHFAELLQQRSEALEKLRRQVERAAHTEAESQHQLELDTDAEVQAMGDRQRAALHTQREGYLRMRAEGAIMRRNAQRIERELEVRSKELQLLDGAKAVLAAQLAELQQRIAQLHQDISERDAVLGTKEKAIYAVKRECQELEKYKFVLDHRIRQLKSQMEPKQREIALFDQRIAVKNRALEAYHESNVTLRANITDLTADLAQQQAAIRQYHKEIKDAETYKSRLKKDVGELAAALHEPAKLRSVVSELYQRHVVARGGARVAKADPRVRQEFAEQLEYLSSTVSALRQQMRKDQRHHQAHLSTMMEANLALIREIHSLREAVEARRAVLATEVAARRARGGAEPPAETETSTADAQTIEVLASTTVLTNPSMQPTRPVGSSATRSGGGLSSNSSAPRAAPLVRTQTREANESARRAPVPHVIVENREVIRQQRAYIAALERALANYKAPRHASSVKSAPLPAKD